MGDLRYYLSLPYKLEIFPDKDEGGYAAKYPDLQGCVTCADSLDELMVNAEDAKKAWLEAAMKDGLPIMAPTDSSKHSH